MKRAKQEIGITLVFAVLFLACSVIQCLVAAFPLTDLVGYIACGICIFWGITSNKKILSKNTRMYFAELVVSILLLLVIRIVKYHFVKEFESADRVLWYIYYVPYIFISITMLKISINIGKAESYKPPRALALLDIAGLCMAIMIITNDYHHFAFKPDESYSIGYWVALGFIAILLTISFATIVKKCTISELKRYAWLPPLILLLGFGYTLTFAFGFEPRINGFQVLGIPDAISFTIILFLESCISIGLIPSNTEYESLFERLSISAEIYDNNDNVAFNSTRNVSDSENIVVHTSSITGGYVKYYEDISKLNKVKNELGEIKVELEAEKDILTEENEIKKKEASINASNKLYDEIALLTVSQSTKISELCENAENDYSKSIRLICFYGAHIKRIANLKIISQNSKTINTGEFSLSVNESLRYLEYLGVDVYSKFDSNENMDARVLIGIYQQFEESIEEYIDKLVGVSVFQDGLNYKLILELDDTEKHIILKGGDAIC